MFCPKKGSVIQNRILRIRASSSFLISILINGCAGPHAPLTPFLSLPVTVEWLKWCSSWLTGWRTSEEPAVGGGRRVTVFDQKTRAVAGTEHLKRWNKDAEESSGPEELELSRWRQTGSIRATLWNESSGRTYQTYRSSWFLPLCSVLIDRVLFNSIFLFVTFYSQKVFFPRGL